MNEQEDRYAGLPSPPELDTPKYLAKKKKRDRSRLKEQRRRKARALQRR